MDERATGLVLRMYPLTESSLIVHWLTREQGRIATVAKGARRPKSSFRGKIDLFFLCDLLFARSRKSELHTLREVTLIEPHPALRSDLAGLQRASYAVSLVTQTTEADTPVPELFELMVEFLRIQGSLGPVSTLAFELKLLHALGLAPDAAETKLTAGSKRLVEHLAQTDWPDLHRLRISAAQLREIEHFLHGFLVYHLGKIPSGRAAALENGV
jgi:DNA repair protein RecO (recombination protein O)